MPDNSIHLAKEAWDGIKWLLVAALGLLGFNLRRMINKVDDHDRNHVSRDELNKTVNALRKETKQDFRDVHAKLDRLIERS